MFDLNENGSVIAYLYEDSVVVISQQLGVVETVYPCYNAALYFRYYDKCADTKSIFLFTFSTIIILLVFDVVVFGGLLVCFVRRRCQAKREP